MSQFLGIKNVIVARLFEQAAVVVDTARVTGQTTNDTIRLVETDRSEHPDSVVVIQAATQFSPSSRAAYDAEYAPAPYYDAEPAVEPQSTRLRVLVQWSIDVEHMDWLRRVTFKGIHSEIGDPRTWVAELQTADTVLRPDLSPESGTRLLLTFVVRHR